MCVYRCYPLVIEHRHIPMEIISSRSIPKVQELLDEETVVQLFRFLLHPDGRADGVVIAGAWRRGFQKIFLGSCKMWLRVVNRC